LTGKTKRRFLTACGLAIDDEIPASILNIYERFMLIAQRNEHYAEPSLETICGIVASSDLPLTSSGLTAPAPPRRKSGRQKVEA